MKNKHLISISALALLTVSLLASCNKGNSCSHVYGEWTPDKNAGAHVRYCELCGAKEEAAHHFSQDSVVLKEANCKEDGLEAIVCDICHYTIETTIPKTSNHKYDTFLSHDSKNHSVECSICGKVKTESHKFNVELPNVNFLKSEATCEKAATYYTSCECGACSKDTVYEETFSFGSPKDHEIYGLAIKSNPKKLSYSAYESFDPDGLVLTYSCGSCKKSGFEVKAEDGITFSYQGSNTSFRVGETMIQANYLGKSVNINGITVNKNTNDIYGLKDIDTTCGEYVDLSDITCKLGKLEINVFDKNDNLVEGTNNKYKVYEENAPYRIEAKVQGTTQYDEVPTRTATIGVTHAYGIDADENVSKCLCGKYAVEKYFYIIDEAKVYTEGTFGEKADIAINGTLIDPSTGKTPDFSYLDSGDNMVVKATKGNETINFYVTGVTTILKTEEDLNRELWAFEHDVSGYFLLGNDIESWTTNSFEDPNQNIGGTKTTVKVTLDGLGHHIKKFKTGSKYGGIFGARNVTGSVFTDLNFDSIVTTTQMGGLFGYVGDNIDFRNSTFVAGADKTCLGGGVLAYKNNTFTNCVFDFGAYNDVCIFYTTGAIDEYHFTNSVAYYTEGKEQNVLRSNPSRKIPGLVWIKK